MQARRCDLERWSLTPLEKAIALGRYLLELGRAHRLGRIRYSPCHGPPAWGSRLAEAFLARRRAFRSDQDGVMLAECLGAESSLPT